MAQTIEDATGIWAQGPWFMYSRGVRIAGSGPRVFFVREDPTRSLTYIGIGDGVVNRFVPGVYVGARSFPLHDDPRELSSRDTAHEFRLSTDVGTAMNPMVDLSEPAIWQRQQNAGSVVRAPIGSLISRGRVTYEYWFGNDGGIYLVARAPANRFAWFGYHCSPGRRVPRPWANVFEGRFDESTSIVAGLWADVPYGVARGAGRLQLNLGEVIRRVDATGGFGGSLWLRRSQIAALPVNALTLTFRTLSDGNRRNAADFAIVRFTDGPSVTRRVDRDDWGDDVRNTTFSANVSLPSGRTIGSIREVIVRHDGSSSNSLENWDEWEIEEATVRARTPSGEFCITSVNAPPKLRQDRKLLRFQVAPFLD